MVASVVLSSTLGTEGAGGAFRSSGRTNAIRPWVVPRSVIKTGVVMAILVSEALPFEMYRNNRMSRRPRWTSPPVATGIGPDLPIAGLLEHPVRCTRVPRAGHLAPAGHEGSEDHAHGENWETGRIIRQDSLNPHPAAGMRPVQRRTRFVKGEPDYCSPKRRLLHSGRRVRK